LAQNDPVGYPGIRDPAGRAEGLCAYVVYYDTVTARYYADSMKANLTAKDVGPVQTNADVVIQLAINNA
jgi:hypothetical protein